MKKFLMVLGAVFGLVIVALGIAMVFALRQTDSIAADAKPYIDDAVIAITSTWDSKELLSRLTKEVRQNTNPEDVEALFDRASASLGPITDYLGAELRNWRSGTSIGEGSFTVAEFFVNARFPKGDASFSVTLHRRSSKWSIHGFQIHSSALLQGIARRKT